MRREELYLWDMVETADSIRDCVAGNDLAAFRANDILRSAVTYKLVIIGEAAARLPSKFTKAHPGVPWAGIVGFRNFAVHQYFHVDWAIVWDTATIAVPEMRRQVADILAREYPNSQSSAGAEQS